MARFALVPVALLLIGDLVSATCYFPNGDTAPSGHSPCASSTDGGSTCCADKFECLSNGLCNDFRYPNWTRLLRGACTDAGFGGACNNVCVNLWPQGDEAVWYCDGGKYCCGVDKTCCANGSVEKHDLGEPVVVAVAGATTSVSSVTASRTSSSPGPTVSKDSDNSSTNNILPIAIGVGVAVGVLLFIILVMGCWYIRRRRTLTSEQHINVFVIFSDLTAYVRRKTSPYHSTGGVAHELDGNDPAYKYDDKIGGWSNGGKDSRRNIYEVAGERGIELPTRDEAVEIEGARLDGRGRHMRR